MPRIHLELSLFFPVHLSTSSALVKGENMEKAIKLVLSAGLIALRADEKEPCSTSPV
jgi:hypothetical protein